MVTVPFGMLCQSHVPQKALKHLTNKVDDQLAGQHLGPYRAVLERVQLFCAPLAPAFQADDVPLGET